MLAKFLQTDGEQSEFNVTPGFLGMIGEFGVFLKKLGVLGTLGLLENLEIGMMLYGSLIWVMYCGDSTCWRYWPSCSIILSFWGLIRPSCGICCDKT